MADDRLDMDGVVSEETGGDQAVATADVEAAGGANLDLLMDVDMKLTVELGRARLKFRDVLNLSNGSVVELAKLTSEPVDGNYAGPSAMQPYRLAIVVEVIPTTSAWGRSSSSISGPRSSSPRPSPRLRARSRPAGPKSCGGPFSLTISFARVRSRF